MANVKLGFDDFIAAVDTNCAAFVKEMHSLFMDAGCKIEVK